MIPRSLAQLSRTLCTLLLLAVISIQLSSGLVLGSAPQDEREFRLDAIQGNWSWFYGHTSRQLVLTGSFPYTRLDLATYTVLFSTGSETPFEAKAGIFAMESDFIGITTPLLQHEHHKVALQVCYVLNPTTIGTTTMPTISMAPLPVCLTYTPSLFHIVVPVYAYITPFSAPLAPGETELRIALSGLRPQSSYTVYFDDYQVDLLDLQPHYTTLRLPSTFPNDLDYSRYYSIRFIDLETNTAAVTVDNGVSLYAPEKNYNRYVTKTVPSWLTTGPDDTHKHHHNYIQARERTVMVIGHGLLGAKTLILTHPLSHEPLFFDLAPNTIPSATLASFTVPLFHWSNSTVFPLFNATKYKDVVIPRGPAWFDVVDAEGEFITAGEITLVPSPRLQSFIPSTQIPANYAVASHTNPKPHQRVSILSGMGEFPLDVPVKVSYVILKKDPWTTLTNLSPTNPTNLTDSSLTPTLTTTTTTTTPDPLPKPQWSLAPLPFSHLTVSPTQTIAATAALGATTPFITPGYFVADSAQFEFSLPPCVDCKLPSSGPICLTADSDQCMYQITTFDYLPPQLPQIPTVTQTVTHSLFFEDYESTVTAYFYGFTELDSTSNTTLGYKHLKSGTILPLEHRVQTTAQSISGSLPHHAGIPGVYPEGVYVPILMVGTTVTEVAYNNQLAPVTFSFNRKLAYHLAIPTTYDFSNAAIRANATKGFVDVLSAIYKTMTGPDPQYFLRLDPTPIVSESENNDINSTRNGLLLSGGGMMINIVIRPNSTISQPDPIVFVHQLVLDLSTPKTPLHTTIPELVTSKPTITVMNYCPATLRYQFATCSVVPTPTKKLSVATIVLIIFAIAAVLATTLYFVRTRTSLLATCFKPHHQLHEREDLLLGDTEIQ